MIRCFACRNRLSHVPENLCHLLRNSEAGVDDCVHFPFEGQLTTAPIVCCEKASSVRAPGLAGSARTNMQPVVRVEIPKLSRISNTSLSMTNVGSAARANARKASY